MFNNKKKRVEHEINKIATLIDTIESMLPMPEIEKCTATKKVGTGSGHPALFPEKELEQRTRTLEIKIDLLFKKLNLEMVKTITETDYKKDTKYSLATVKKTK